MRTALYTSFLISEWCRFKCIKQKNIRKIKTVDSLGKIFRDEKIELTPHCFSYLLLIWEQRVLHLSAHNRQTKDIWQNASLRSKSERWNLCLMAQQPVDPMNSYYESAEVLRDQMTFTRPNCRVIIARRMSRSREKQKRGLKSEKRNPFGHWRKMTRKLKLIPKYLIRQSTTLCPRKISSLNRKVTPYALPKRASTLISPWSQSILTGFVTEWSLLRDSVNFFLSWTLFYNEWLKAESALHRVLRDASLD